MKTNESFVDVWSLAHVATGYTARKIGVPFFLYMGGAVLFERIEHSMEYPDGHPTFGTKRPETLKNVIGDLVVGALGYYLAD